MINSNFAKGRKWFFFGKGFEKKKRNLIYISADAKPHFMTIQTYIFTVARIHVRSTYFQLENEGTNFELHFWNFNFKNINFGMNFELT